MWVEPLRLADSDTTLVGALPLTGMDRLLTLLQSDRGEVEVRLRFAVDAGGRPTLSGHLKARVELLCQYCMTPVEVDLEGDVRLHIVASLAEADRLDDPNEVLETDGRPMKLGELVQDELILLLPIVPGHAQGRCAASSSADETGQDVRPSAEPEAAPGGEDGGAQRPNPFAVLAALKRPH